MSDLPPPPSPPGGWPQQTRPLQPPPQPAPPQWPGQQPGYGGYGAPPAPPGQGPWGSPAGYGYGGPTGPGYASMKAGFWARFAAAFIDGILVGILIVPAYIALVAGPKDTQTCFIDESGDPDVFSDQPANGLCETPSGSAWALFAVLYGAALVGAVIYFSQMEGKSGQTLGKKALNIKVVDVNSGGPIGVGRGVGRYFARWVSAIACYLGYLWMLWDPQKQTWHDKMTSSVVIKA